MSAVVSQGSFIGSIGDAIELFAHSGLCRRRGISGNYVCILRTSDSDLDVI